MGQHQPVRVIQCRGGSGTANTLVTGVDGVNPARIAGIDLVLIDDEWSSQRVFCEIARDLNCTLNMYSSVEDFLKDPKYCTLILLAHADKNQCIAEIIQRLHERLPHMRCVIFSRNATLEAAVAAMRSGALDYLSWPRSIAALSSTVQSWIRVARRLQTQISQHGLSQTLTERERAVAAMVGIGFSNREMSVALGISRRTVEYYRRSAMRKYGLKNPIDAVRIWASL